MTLRLVFATMAIAGSCGSSLSGGTTPSAPARAPESAPDDEPFEEGYPSTSKCSMQGQRCPADDLPRFSSGLSEREWAALQARSATAAVRLEGPSAQLMEGCRLPGEYVEVVRDETSPGRLRASTRLVFAADDLHGCERATHVVAAYAVRDGAAVGEAIALPLPCPRRGVAQGCIGAGLDAAGREEQAQARFDRALPAFEKKAFSEVLVDVVELNALLPTPSNYAFVAAALEYLSSTDYGGCWWLTDAQVVAHELGGSVSARVEERPELQHEFQDCWTRPSLATCFPDHFVPGTGGNCW